MMPPTVVQVTLVYNFLQIPIDALIWPRIAVNHRVGQFGDLGG